MICEGCSKKKIPREKVDDDVFFSNVAIPISVALTDINQVDSHSLAH